MSEHKREQHMLRVNGEGDFAFTRIDVVLFALVAGLFVAARLWRLTASCLWFDEIFSIHATRYDWPNLITFVGMDIIHPPLFYLFLKGWINFPGGESLAWLRLFPALTSMLSVVPFVLLCRELRLKPVEINLALLLMAVNGYLIKYAQEVRMYSLLLFFGLCSLWLFVRFFNSRSHSWKLLAALSAINLLMIYTHYFGWMLIATESIFVMWRGGRKILPFIISTAGVAVGFAPWLYVVLRLAAGGAAMEQNLGWAARPVLADVARFLVLLHEPFYFRQSSHEPLFLRGSAIVGALLFVVPVASLCWRSVVRRNREEGDRRRAAVVEWLLLCSFAPVVLAFFSSQFLPQSIWGTRHLIIVAAPYMILIAVALRALRPAWLGGALVLLLACWTLLAGAFVLLKRESPYVWCAWDALARQMVRAEVAGADEIKVYAFEDLVAYHLWFTLQGNADGRRFRVAVTKGVPTLIEDTAYFLPRGFHEVEVKDARVFPTGEHFWIAFRDTEWNEARAPLNLLRERGYQTGITFELSARGQRAFIVPVWRK